MSLSRRTLFASLAGTGLAAAGLLATTADAKKSKTHKPAVHNPYKQIGVQLYTVRDAWAAAPKSTLQVIRALGFDQVEMIGLNGHTPAEIKTWLNDLGLTAPSGHLGDWMARAEAGMDDLAALGASYAVIPYLADDQRKEWSAFAAKLNDLGAKAKARGLKLAYHNHDFEFVKVGDKTALDVLLAQTDPSLVWFELDCYWAAHGGQDPVAMLKRDPTRYRMLHLKDMAADRNMAPVGKGTIDYRKVLSTAHTNGVEFVFVEHDNPVNPFDSINQSIKYLKTL